MKKILLAGTLAVLFSFTAAAQDMWEPVRFEITSVNTSATARTFVTPSAIGQVVGAVIIPQTNMTVTIETTAETGMSHAAKTIVAATNVVRGVGNAAVVGTHYVWGDTFTVGAHTAADSNLSVYGFILIRR